LWAGLRSTSLFPGQIDPPLHLVYPTSRLIGLESGTGLARWNYLPGMLESDEAMRDRAVLPRQPAGRQGPAEAARGTDSSGLPYQPEMRERCADVLYLWRLYPRYPAL